MVQSPKKQEIAYEAPESSPISRVVTRRPVSWVEAMERIYRAVVALPRETEAQEDEARAAEAALEEGGASALGRDGKSE
jgi:hypothetical protein